MRTARRQIRNVRANYAAIPVAVVIDRLASKSLLDSQAELTRPPGAVSLARRSLGVNPDASIAAAQAGGVQDLGSWLSRAVRAVGPVVAPIVGAVNPAAGAALAVAQGALFPTRQPAQEPAPQPAAAFPLEVVPDPAPAPAPAAKQLPAWVVPAAVGGGLLLLFAMTKTKRR